MTDFGPVTDFEMVPPPLSLSYAAATSGPRAVFIGDLARYGLCSALALALDWGTLIGLTANGVAPLAAAAIGFTLGMALTYGLSISFVFANRRNPSRWVEALAFVSIGIAGLGVNQLMLWALMHAFALPAGLAKAPTAVVVFLFNFVLRRMLAFTTPRG